MELNNDNTKPLRKKATFKKAPAEEFSKLEKEYNDLKNVDVKKAKDAVKASKTPANIPPLPVSPSVAIPADGGEKAGKDLDFGYNEFIATEETLTNISKSKDKNYDVSDYVKNLLHGYENDLLDSYSHMEGQFGKIVDWGDVDVSEIVQRLLVTSEAIAGIRLFPYQKAFIYRVIESVLLNDGEEITALWSRQCCFENAKVSMANGGYKKIKDVQVGDKILSINEKTNTLEDDVIEDVWYTGKKPVIKISTLAGFKSGSSADHLFYLPHGWEKAGDVPAVKSKIGVISNKYIRDKLKGDVFWDTVISKEECPPEDMYDIRTRKNHNFIADGFVVHNSGKTECVTVAMVTLMTMLPILAQHFPQLSQFKKGFHVGVFAPTEPQAKTIGERFRLRIQNEMAVEFLSDPEVGIISSDLGLSNGSYVRIHSAAPQSKVESKTYHLVVVDEAADVDEDKVVKSIAPMLAATAGTMVKIGNPNLKHCEFLQAINRNVRLEAVSKGKVRNHFEFDYKVVCKYNDRYAKFIAKEKIRYGEDSDFFRMSYKLEWLLSKGMAISPDDFEKKVKNISIKIEPTPDHRFMYVAGLDLGRKHDSTVLTIGKMVRRKEPPRRHDFEDWENEEDVFLEADLFQKQISNWFEYEGDNWESQINDIVRVIARYETMQVLALDATGVGDPVHEIIARRLSGRDITIIPVYFSLNTQHQLSQLFYKNVEHGNLVVPAHFYTRKTQKYNRFYRQLLDAEKIWKNDKRILRHGTYKGAKDDYVQSLLLMLKAAEETASAGGFQQAPNYFRMNSDPRVSAGVGEDYMDYVDNLLHEQDITGFQNVRRAAAAGRLGVKKATFVLKN